MDNTKKLKVVFDFIADYLSEEKEIVIEPMSEESKEELTITENKSEEEESKISAHLKRAYTIMKKIDERDEAKAITTHAVNEATRPLKKQIEETKRRFEEVQSSNTPLTDEGGILSNPKKSTEITNTKLDLLDTILTKGKVEQVVAQVDVHPIERKMN